eukprot:gene27083-30616_t
MFSSAVIWRCCQLMLDVPVLKIIAPLEHRVPATVEQLTLEQVKLQRDVQAMCISLSDLATTSLG